MSGQIRHGHNHTAKYGGRSLTYVSWMGAKGRCFNLKDKDYPRYGGRGIMMCKEWADSFSKFYEDMGRRPGHEFSIERINNNKGYEPGNCKWATVKEQNNNKRYLRGRFIDLSGRIFGELIVLKETESQIKKDGSKRIMYLCKCSCGEVARVRGTSLTTENTRSCGHLKFLRDEWITGRSKNA